MKDKVEVLEPKSFKGTTDASRYYDLFKRRKTWMKIIYLMHDDDYHYQLPGEHLIYTKIKHNVFWTYDPRGAPKSVMTSDHFYSNCKCPYCNCANIVFGDACIRHVEEYLLTKDKYFKKITTRGTIHETFRKTYWKLVHSKMIMNIVQFPPGFKFKTDGSLPGCITCGKLRKLLTKYHKETAKNDKYIY